ncbi:MAG: FecR family protein [Halioglobus sp.]
MNVQVNKESALQQATEWFAKLESGEVTNEVKAAFFAWLDTDEINQQSYIEIEQLWGNLELAERLPVDDMLDNRGWFTGVFSGWAQVGAAVSVLAVATMSVFYVYSPAKVIEQHYVTAVGERMDFRLDDGSLLQLNTNSAVSVRMEESRRLLTLQRGEAYFDIAPNSARPLTVQTAGGMVRVLGTQFNIRQIDSGSTVSVIEGRVAVATEDDQVPLDGSEFVAELTLIANQQVLLQQNQPVIVASSVDGDIVAAWRQGQLIYEGNTLADVVADLNRYFPGTISLDDPALAAMEIVGVINLQNRTSTLAALEATFPVQVVSVTDDLTLIQPRTE